MIHVHNHHKELLAPNVPPEINSGASAANIFAFLAHICTYILGLPPSSSHFLIRTSNTCLILFSIRVHKSISFFFLSPQFSSSPYHCMTSVCESLCFAIRSRELTKTATSVDNSWISSAAVRRGPQRLSEAVYL